MKGLMKRESDRSLLGFRDEMERFFDSFFNLNSFSELSQDFKGFNIDISEDEKEFHIESDLPGIEKENLNIEIKDSQLIITASKDQHEEKKDRTYYRMERSYGKFMRSIPLPENVDTQNINAEFKNGVLKIDITKKEVIKNAAKKIEIK